MDAARRDGMIDQIVTVGQRSRLGTCLSRDETGKRREFAPLGSSGVGPIRPAESSVGDRVLLESGGKSQWDVPVGVETLVVQKRARNL
jgi:hypothetical protein